MLGFLKQLIGEAETSEVTNTTDPNSARVASGRDLLDHGLTRGRGIPLGYFTDSGRETRLHYGGENHLVTVGKPGSGKGTTAIIPTLLEYDGSVLVIDPKGQNAAVTARQRLAMGHEVHILNPYGLHRELFAQLGLGPTSALSFEDIFDTLDGSSAAPPGQGQFNPLARIDPESEHFVGDVRSLAEALIITEGKDPHWPNAARELVTALLMYVCVKPGELRSLGRVRELLTLRIEEPKEDGTPAGGFLGLIAEMRSLGYPPLGQKAEQFSAVTKEVESIISTARTQLAFLDDPAIRRCLDGSAVDFAEMKRRKVTVYLILPAKHLEAQSRWLRLVITAAIDSLIGEPQPGDGRALLILDEFAQLGHLKAVEKAIALVRGYGVQLWMIVQDLHQLRHLYGERWPSFLATAGVQQFFTPNDEMTAETLKKRIGEHLVKRGTVSHSEISKDAARQGFTGISTSAAETWEPLVREHMLYGMERDKQILVLEGLAPVILAQRRPYHAPQAGYAGRFDPDPYHR
jgi:type IV secretion system protein VirD4